jgi:hypothetical protein
MLDVRTEVNQDKEPDSLMEEIGATCVEKNGILRNNDSEQALKKEDT